jgi:Skp family chaperone for outer membrane proteins
VVVSLLTAVILYNSFRSINITKNLSNSEGVKIAVLDGEKLKATAKCFKAHETIAEMFTKILSKMRDIEKQMKSEYETIKHNGKLSQKQKAKEITKMETKWDSVSARYNARIQSLRNLDLQLSGRIQHKLDLIIKKIAQRGGIQLVINKGNRELLAVFYAAPKLEITDLVVQQLDEDLPKVDLKEMGADG